MIRLAASLFGAFSWALVAFFSVRFPAADSLGPARVNPAWAWGWLVILAGVLAWLFWMLPFREGEGILARKRYGARIVLSLAVQSLLAFLSASFLHRDFASLFFQAAAIHFGLFVDAAPLFPGRFYRLHADRLFVVAMSTVGFFLCWIGFMGYAIATRAEPRWIPSLGYNILNLGICGYLTVANFGLRDMTKRELVVMESGLFLEGLDVLPLVAFEARPLVLHLAAVGGGASISCFEGQAVLGGGGCQRDCASGGACARYPKVQGAMQEAGRLFSALRIGKLSPASLAPAPAERSWIFVPDPSVRMLAPRDPAAALPHGVKDTAPKPQGLSETPSFR
jgi:hypothetical protein